MPEIDTSAAAARPSRGARLRVEMSVRVAAKKYSFVAPSGHGSSSGFFSTMSLDTTRPMIANSTTSNSSLDVENYS